MCGRHIYMESHQRAFPLSLRPFAFGVRDRLRRRRAAVSLYKSALNPRPLAQSSEVARRSSRPLPNTEMSNPRRAKAKEEDQRRRNNRLRKSGEFGDLFAALVALVAVAAVVIQV